MQVLALQYFLINRIGNRRHKKNFFLHTVNFLSGRFHIYPQDVDLVRIPQNCSKAIFPFCQVIRQLIYIMQPDGLFYQLKIILTTLMCVFRYSFQKISNQPVTEQNVRTKLCMIDGKGIPEGVEMAQLFKAPNVMEHSKEPGKVFIVFLQAQFVGNQIAQRCHTESMIHFQFHFYIG